MYRDFQSRLDMKHSIMKRKIIDNQISLAGNPTDVIRLSITYSDEGDKIATRCKKADVINVIMPEFKEVPIRKLHKNDANGYVDESVGKYQITSLVGIASEEDTNNEEKFKIYFPHGSDINVDDLIIKTFLDPDVKDPIILALKVSEVFGTFTNSMLLWESAICTLEMEDLPQKLVDIIGSMAERRLHIKF